MPLLMSASLCIISHPSSVPIGRSNTGASMTSNQEVPYSRNRPISGYFSKSSLILFRVL